MPLLGGIWVSPRAPPPPLPALHGAPKVVRVVCVQTTPRQQPTSGAYTGHGKTNQTPDKPIK